MTRRKKKKPKQQQQQKKLKKQQRQRVQKQIIKLLPQGIQTSQTLTYFISPEVFERSSGSSSSIHEDFSSPDTNRVPTAGARHA